MADQSRNSRAAPPSRQDGLLRFTVRAMVLADLGFLAYWILVISKTLPRGVMFPEYTDPHVAAWNWSFLPLDIAASLLGLSAAHAGRRGASPANTARLTISLALTATAGGLALTYWAQTTWVDAAWWGPNVALLLFPLPMLTRLALRGAAGVPARQACPQNPS